MMLELTLVEHVHDSMDINLAGKWMFQILMMCGKSSERLMAIDGSDKFMLFSFFSFFSEQYSWLQMMMYEQNSED